MGNIKSYASSSNPIAVLRDGLRLVRGAGKHRREMADETVKGIQIAQRMCEQVRAATGVELSGKRTLEIGAGPLPCQLAYLAARNEAVGIDLDVYPRGLNLGDYLQVLKRNGPV